VIVKNSDKIITFIDLCGHEKYLKTTIFGLVGHNLKTISLSFPGFVVVQYDCKFP
jgi:GTPase